MFSVGKSGMNPMDSARMIQKAVEMFQQTNPVHLKTIKLVIFKEKLLQCFQKLAIGDYYQPKHSVSKPSSTFDQQPHTSARAFQQPTNVKIPEKSIAVMSRQNSTMLKFCSVSQTINQEVSKTLMVFSEMIDLEFCETNIEAFRFRRTFAYILLL